jgi:hypothetical protein
MLYAFRIRQADHTITHHGVVTVANPTDLFYALDEYGDPSFCEVKKIKNLSFCVDTVDDLEYGGFAVGSELEFGDSFESAIMGDMGWCGIC